MKNKACMISPYRNSLLIIRFYEMTGTIVVHSVNKSEDKK